jgi:superfamily II DNA or RNA helicase
MTNVIDDAPLPEWFRDLRDHQEEALERISIAFEDDEADVVFLDAPTGSGKTLIGEMARRRLGVSGLYVCSDKALQTQFMTGLPIRGRNQGSEQLSDRVP